jgi:indole-3-glycerol phosphate synthase
MYDRFEPMGFLSETIERVRAEVRAGARRERPERHEPLPAPRDFAAALIGTDVAIVAEIKRASPSAGAIVAPELDAARQAARYRSGGAAAISVLTDGPRFGGSLDDLRAVRRAVDVPVLRKDFIVDASQIGEARSYGADAVLLITAALSDDELRELLAATGACGMQALVETHTPGDVDRALAAGASTVGVNARDLETLEVDLERALVLVPSVAASATCVLESGVAARRDVVRAAEAGAAAVLVGEALMRAADPAAKLRELAGR